MYFVGSFSGYFLDVCLKDRGIGLRRCKLRNLYVLSNFQRLTEKKVALTRCLYSFSKDTASSKYIPHFSAENPDRAFVYCFFSIIFLNPFQFFSPSKGGVVWFWFT